MKRKPIDTVVFLGMLVVLAYQYTLLYLSVIGGSWVNFSIVAGTFLLGLLLGRTTYLILGAVLAFVSMSVGGLLLAMSYTRDLYLWGSVALLTVTPVTTYFMYILDHRLLKRRAVADTLTDLRQTKPDMEMVTGALNRTALERAVERELLLVFYHERDYRFTLTLVKIDFLENVVNFLGSERLNVLLKTTADHVATLLFKEDRLFYLGNGKFIILSPMLNQVKAPLLRQKLKQRLDLLAVELGLEQTALVLRTGQLTVATPEHARDCTLASALAQLERSAETDIVKEYV